MLNTGKISSAATTKKAGPKLFANNPKDRKQTAIEAALSAKKAGSFANDLKTQTLGTALFKVQESMARAITTTQSMPAANVLRSANTKREYKANQTSPQIQSPKSTPTLGVIINDTSFQGSNISGNSDVKNFSSFDFKSARVIDTSAFKGATITGGKISNFSGTR